VDFKAALRSALDNRDGVEAARVLMAAARIGWEFARASPLEALRRRMWKMERHHMLPLLLFACREVSRGADATPVLNALRDNINLAAVDDAGSSLRSLFL